MAWAKGNGLKLWSAEETPSTNTIAKDDSGASANAKAEAATAQTRPMALGPDLYLARYQTQGRGRGTNQWHAPSGGALLSSWAFSLSSVPQPILSPLVGLALYDAAIGAWPTLAFSLKAPNDLYLGNKKLAGLLIETVVRGAVKRTVVGLGFNVTQAPDGVATATCLQDHLRAALDEAWWHSFLNLWLARLRKAVVEGQSQRLTTAAAHALREALNRHPLLEEPIIKVDERGQLHSATRVIYWHEL